MHGETTDAREATLAARQDPIAASDACQDSSAAGDALERARHALLAKQEAAGHWCYELEADCTIPAEYILMMQYVGRVDEALQAKMAVYLRERQAEHDGWPLYRGGALDISATVKAYWALKVAGDDPGADHMRRARAALLLRGGAAKANVFTRYLLAFFEQVPWRAVPYLPIEIVLLPRWFPFHLSKISYWSRAVVVPLAVLYTMRAKAQNPSGVDVRELFRVPPEEERDYFPVRSALNRAFFVVERCARRLDPLIPGAFRRRSLRAAERWIAERLNGSDGLGAIFPAMVNAYEALMLFGHGEDHPLTVRAREAIDGLVVEHEGWAYCQPCFSPIWDTGLAFLALHEANGLRADSETDAALERAAAWIVSKQVLDGPADWRRARPDLAPGGWAFQHENPHYPDLDDTAVVAWALHVLDPVRFAEPVRRAADWIAGMQSKNGGYAAFDADNTHDHLNEIPFADHGALLDPPTADVSARCVTFLGLLGRQQDLEEQYAALDYLFAEQEENGAWFGRWGTNYIYGTWSVLTALERIDDPRKEEAERRAVHWLQSVQRSDGSWGENNDTYAEPSLAGTGSDGTPYQTAWALLALCAAGAGRSQAVERGVAYLTRTQQPDGLWNCELFTAPGFPRVFYLRYHGYADYFPLWALARCGRAQLPIARARHRMER